MNGGTIGGRSPAAPSVAGAPPRRCRTAIPAISGASSITRVSLTTIAVASAMLPAVDEVATTCATSWTLAPTHAPNCSSSSPSGPRSGGSTTIASVPHSVTSATENATSSSSASMTPFAAAIAETPQIEKPVATSSERSSEMPSRRPAQRVPKNVIATTATTTSERLEAEREDVREDEVEAEQDDAELEHRPRRGPQAGSRRRRHVRDVGDERSPSATQRTSGGRAGSARWAPSETATPAPARASPGARRIIRPAGGTGSGSPSAARASP